MENSQLESLPGIETFVQKTQVDNLVSFPAPFTPEEWCNPGDQTFHHEAFPSTNSDYRKEDTGTPICYLDGKKTKDNDIRDIYQDYEYQEVNKNQPSFYLTKEQVYETRISENFSLNLVSNGKKMKYWTLDSEESYSTFTSTSLAAVAMDSRYFPNVQQCSGPGNNFDTATDTQEMQTQAQMCHFSSTSPQTLVDPSRSCTMNLSLANSDTLGYERSELDLECHVTEKQRFPPILDSHHSRINQEANDMLFNRISYDSYLSHANIEQFNPTIDTVQSVIPSVQNTFFSDNNSDTVYANSVKSTNVAPTTRQHICISPSYAQSYIEQGPAYNDGQDIDRREQACMVSNILPSSDISDVLYKDDKHPISPNPRDTRKSKSVDGNSHSYIALISKAILSSPTQRLLLSDIYQFIR